VSNLALSNKDDYPAAAAKHLDDASALVDAERYDAAGYLAGYVVECSLRTVVLVGEIAKRANVPTEGLAEALGARSRTLRRFIHVAAAEARARGRGHDLDELVDATTGYRNELSSATATYAPPIDKKKPPFGGAWSESIRYRAMGDVTKEAAKTWLQEADTVYKSTIGMMIRDGLIRK
jgi:hypothetical protein